MNQIEQLRNTITDKILNAKTEFLEQHGYPNADPLDEGKEINELFDNCSITPDHVYFDSTRRHVGSLLAGREFNLTEADVYYGADEDVRENERIFGHGSLREALAKRTPMTLHMQIMSARRIEDWTVWLTDDSPPYAFNRADAEQVKTQPEFLSARRKIVAGFGEEAVPLLSPDEVGQLVVAVAQTPASLLDKWRKFY